LTAPRSSTQAMSPSSAATIYRADAAGVVERLPVPA
jgi:hypothetical protein